LGSGAGPFPKVSNIVFKYFPKVSKCFFQFWLQAAAAAAADIVSPKTVLK